MIIFMTALLLNILLLPSLLLRYLPFAPFLTSQQKKQLSLAYFVWFCILLSFNLWGLYQHGFTIPIYKRTIILGWLPYFFINLYYIPGHLAHHLFVAGIQCIYILLLHSAAIDILIRNFPQETLMNLYYMQSALFIFMFALTFPILRRFFNRMFLSAHIFNDHTYWRAVCLLPLFIAADGIYISSEETIQALDLFLPRFLLIPTFLVLLHAFIWDAKGMERKAALGSNHKLLAMQLASLKEHTQVMAEAQQKMAVVRHDIRHYNRLLYALIQEDKLEEALKMINRCDQSLLQTTTSLYCHNPIINAALAIYISRAAKENIPLTHQIDLPASLQLDENELAILFCNLLENAIKASLKQPEDDRAIKIITKAEKGHLFLALENRYQGKVKFDQEGFPVTSTAGHGLGMRSLSAFCAKYEAQATCQLEDGWFRTLLLVDDKKAGA